MVRTTHLEIAADTPLRRPTRPRPRYALQHATGITPEYARFLFVAVGEAWHWQSRLPWSRSRWHQHLAQPEVEVWVAYRDGAPAGYFELDFDGDGAVEVAFFGLMPGEIGHGMGGHLLADAVERARHIGTGRVWVHTCDLDHPYALANYQARGFRIFKTEEDEETVVERPPWE